ncbi:MAG TPA: cobyrinate a,c-diamide synthase [Casimicrobiaceae bacterium]|jgi:cobyrinic acid a,c-diamide synthase|nr:cobyrinate a,c-diamide synthase [Casimicrobiaceae bacterium]
MIDRQPRFVVAAPHSGSGKTTVTLGLLLALREKGLSVQPFKIGPDFIDPSHHTKICESTSRNLDTWMCDDAVVQEIFANAASGAHISVIEGVMGLFDGYGPDNDRGSTAHVARLLSAPVVLVIDAQRMATSAAAVALGCRDFDKQLTIAGVIFNNVGGAGHYDWLRKVLETRTGMTAFGYLSFDPTLKIEERHLGLVPAAERGPTETFYQRLRSQMQEHVDIDAILESARQAPALQAPSTAIFRVRESTRKVRIGVAYDQALNFYYQENLDLLSCLGAEIVRFSLLDDEQIPPGLHGLYLGGGFPEIFAGTLSSRQAMNESIRAFHRSGGAIYAECGGLMVLCEALIDFEGRRHEMVGLVPGETVMSRDKLSLGYVEVEPLRDTLIGKAGERYRGQTFHYSVLEKTRFEPVLKLRHGTRTSTDGYASGRLFATYVHAHFAGDPHLAERLVDQCHHYARSLAEAG